MEPHLRKLLGRCWPVFYVGNIRFRWQNRTFRRRFIAQYHRAAKSSLEVLSGPFAGMRYINKSFYSALAPKILGCYEEELHEVFAHAIEAGYDTVIDIGCAEGYYAVGMAVKLPSAQVYAYDIFEAAQTLCTRLSKVNGVAQRVHVGGECDAGLLNSVIEGRTFIISDCEGYEGQLLRPDAAPKLATADMLVELHPGVDPDITEKLRERFEATHNMRIVESADRDPARYPILASLGDKDRDWAVSEFRTGPMQWALLTASG